MQASLKISKTQFGSLCRAAWGCLFSTTICLLDLFFGFFVISSTENEYKLFCIFIFCLFLTVAFSCSLVLFVSLCGYRYSGVWQESEG